MGDVNIDMLHGNNFATKKWVDFQNHVNLKQLIQKPTRMVYTCRKAVKISKKKNTKIVRCYRHLDELLFRADLHRLDWNKVYSCNSTDEAVMCFYELFMSVVNHHMPLKKRRFRIESAPWVNTEFLSLCDRRQFAAKLFDSCPCFLHQIFKKGTERECQRMKNSLKKSILNYQCSIMKITRKRYGA